MFGALSYFTSISVPIIPRQIIADCMRVNLRRKNKTYNVCLSSMNPCDDEEYVDLVNGLASVSMVCAPIGCLLCGNLCSCFVILIGIGFSWVPGGIAELRPTANACRIQVRNVMLAWLTFFLGIRVAFSMMLTQTFATKLLIAKQMVRSICRIIRNNSSKHCTSVQLRYYCEINLQYELLEPPCICTVVQNKRVPSRDFSDPFVLYSFFHGS